MVWTQFKCFFFPFFQQKIKDQFIEQWKSAIENANRLKYYNKYKTEFGIEQYLINIKNDKLRKQVTHFRLSAYKLAMEAERFQNIEREQRLCTFCNQHQIETEFHFLLICPKYTELRKLLIINYTSFPTLTVDNN